MSFWKMSTPQKSEASASPTSKPVLRTPAQDRLKRLQGSAKKITKSTNRRHSDSDDKKCKRSSSKISHRLNVSDTQFTRASASPIAALLKNDAKADATARSSKQQQQQQMKHKTSANVAAIEYGMSPLKQQQQQQITSKNCDESLVLSSFKAKRSLTSRFVQIEQNQSVSGVATSNDIESHGLSPKKKRREDFKFQEQISSTAAKPFQEQKQNITSGVAKIDKKTDDNTYVISSPKKRDKGADDAYLSENLIKTRRNFLHIATNKRTSTSLNDVLASLNAADTPAESPANSPTNSPKNSPSNKSLFLCENENENYKVATNKSNLKTRIKNLWEKPKAAFMGSIKKIQSYTQPNEPGSRPTKNIANNRLARFRSSLSEDQKKPQPNYNYNETFVPSICTLPSSNSSYGCEAMDWQSSEENENDKINQLCNDDVFAKPNTPISNGSVHHLDSTDDYIIKNVMSVETKVSSLSPKKQNCMYFVLDTNVLLNYIVFVEELTKLSLYDNTTGNILFIPYKVIQELDNQKHRGSDSIKIKASRAIRFLNDKFDSKNIQGQTAFDEKKHLIKVTSPDDSIMNCCLQLRKEVHHMILLTDDANLLLKAKINGIMATTKSDLTTKFQSKFLSLNEY